MKFTEKNKSQHGNIIKGSERNDTLACEQCVNTHVLLFFLFYFTTAFLEIKNCVKWKNEVSSSKASEMARWFSLAHTQKHKHKTSENTKHKHKDTRKRKIDKTAVEVKYCVLSCSFF